MNKTYRFKWHAQSFGPGVAILLLGAAYASIAQVQSFELKLTRDADLKAPLWSAVGEEAQSEGQGFLSLAELALWRSPRGLDYKVTPSGLEIWAFDKSGNAVYDFKTRRFQSATGTLRSLQGTSARTVHRPIPDVKRGINSRPFLTAAGLDVAVPARNLRDLFSGYSSWTANGLQLVFQPAFASERSTDYKTGDRTIGWESVRLSRVLVADGALKIQLTAGYMYVGAESKKKNKANLYFEAQFTNVGQAPLLVIPGRLAPVMDKSLPCIIWAPRPYIYMEKQGLQIGGSDRPPMSFVLRPGQVLEVRGYQILNKMPLFPEHTLVWRYSDGYRNLSFGQFIVDRKADRD